MKYKEITKEKYYSFLIEVDTNVFELNITKELVQIKDSVGYLMSESGSWKAEFNKSNSIDGWDLILPSIYEVEFIRANIVHNKIVKDLY